MSRLNRNEIKLKSGFSIPTIKRAIKTAGIKTDSDDRYDEAEVMAAIAAHTDPARVAGHAVAGRGDIAEAAGGAATRGKLGTLADAKARSEIARADKLEIENRRRAGELVEREAVERAGIALFAQTRIALMAVGSKIAPNLMGIADAFQAQRIVESAICEALADLVKQETAIAQIFG